jgi:hypothetical protein
MKKQIPSIQIPSISRHLGLAIAVVSLGIASYSHVSAASSVIAQWDFNSLTVPYSPSTGTGVLAGYGQGNPPSLVSSIVYNGAGADPGLTIGSTVYNRAVTVNPPLVSAGNNSVGASFKVPTTGMAAGAAVRLSWSQTIGYRSSRYWQILVTSDGTNFSPVTGGTGSSIATTVNSFTGSTAPYTTISGTANVTVSSTGLVDFRTISLNMLSATSTTVSSISPYEAGFVNDIQFTLALGQGFENNANFGFAIVAAFDPAYAGTSGSEGYVSSVAGTNSSDATNGYNRSLVNGGSMRLDLVTVSSVLAVPEPGSIGLLALGGCGLLVRRRRVG